MRFSIIAATVAVIGFAPAMLTAASTPAAAYTKCQLLCVRQYHACQQEGGGGCYKIRQHCWNRCARRE
jgi:hypothetical protein